MNKITKGTIAAGAALLLLLGTGGTLAYWNDSANLGGSAITAGQLGVAQNGAPTWRIKHTNGTETTVADITAVRIVPGDQLTYQGQYNITAQGQNLAFTVGLAAGSIAAATPVTAANTALAGRLSASTVFTVNGGAATAPGTTVQINEPGTSNAAITHTATITATITWPFTGTTTQDNPAKLGAVNLSQFALTVTQVDATL